MGLFTERYEKTQTWAVLPSEPYEPENGAERLDAAPTAAPTDLADGTTSVSITVAPAALSPTTVDDDPSAS